MPCMKCPGCGVTIPLGPLAAKCTSCGYRSATLTPEDVAALLKKGAEERRAAEKTLKRKPRH